MKDEQTNTLSQATELPLGSHTFNLRFLDAYPSQAYCINRQHELIYVNPSVEKAYQCSIEQFAGLTIEESPFNIFAPSYNASNELAFENDFFECIEPSMFCGKISPSLAKKIVLRDDNNKITGLMAFYDPLPNDNSRQYFRNHAEIPIDKFIAKHFFYGITTRESEVLYLMLRGQTAPTIGESLNLATRTVNGYIDNMKARLGADSRQELFEKAFQIGFIFFTPRRFQKADAS